MQTAVETNQAVVTTQGGNAAAEPVKLRTRIGSTVYLTNLYFKNSAAETMTDKILRLVKNDLNFTSKNVTIGLPQTGRLPERSSA